MKRNKIHQHFSTIKKGDLVSCRLNPNDYLIVTNIYKTYQVDRSNSNRITENNNYKCLMSDLSITTFSRSHIKKV